MVSIGRGKWDPACLVVAFSYRVQPALEVGLRYVGDVAEGSAWYMANALFDSTSNYFTTSPELLALPHSTWSAIKASGLISSDAEVAPLQLSAYCTPTCYRVMCVQ